MINAINPVGFNRSVQFKGVEQQPTEQPQSEKKGISKTTKTMLGLGALAAITVGGLLAKKHIDLKAVEKFQKDFIPNFEREFGKIEQVEKCTFKDMLVSVKEMLANKGIKNMQQWQDSGYKCIVVRLDKNGLQEYYKGKKLPENLLGKKDGVLVGIIDKDNKFLSSKAFVANELDVSLKEDIFNVNSYLVELNFTEY